MIRHVSCPSCAKKLRVDDASGLTAGKCPKCGQKFRMPWAVSSQPPPPAAVQPAAPQWAPAPPAAPRPAPPQKAWQEDDGPASYNVQAGAPPQPPPGQLLEAEVIDDEGYNDNTPYDDYESPRRKKKKKRKRRSGAGMSLEMSNFLITRGVVGFLWVVLSLFLVFKPDIGTALVVMLIGGTIGSFGWIWFLRTAFEDGVETGLMVMFVPFYPLLYVIGNIERAGKPYAVRMGGMLIVVSALIAYVVGSVREAAMEDEFPPHMSAPAAGRHHDDEDFMPPQRHRPGMPPPGWDDDE